MPTPFEMAKRCAHLMGGNGLTMEQSILLVAHELGDWKEDTVTTTRDGLLYVEHPRSCTDRTPRMVGAPACDWLSAPRGHVFGERYVAFLEDMNRRKILAHA